jgi:hypothetical protein
MKNKHPGSEAMHACDLCSFHAVNKQLLDKHMEDHRLGLVEDNPAKAAERRTTTTHLVLPMDQANLITMAAKEAHVIQENAGAEQPSNIAASYAFESGQDMNVISSQDVIFTLESKSDGKQYFVPSNLSTICLTDQTVQVIPEGEILPEGQMVQVLVDGEFATFQQM